MIFCGEPCGAPLSLVFSVLLAAFGLPAAIFSFSLAPAADDRSGAAAASRSVGAAVGEGLRAKVWPAGRCREQSGAKPDRVARLLKAEPDGYTLMAGTMAISSSATPWR